MKTQKLDVVETYFHKNLPENISNIHSDLVFTKVSSVQQMQSCV